MSGGLALVNGAGVAGLTSAHLLAARGWRVDCAPGSQAPGPVVVVGRPTADLLLELWQADETLFEGAHRLQGRVIHWEPGASSAFSPAPALAMPVDVLRARLAERARAAGVRFVAPGQVDPASYDRVVQAGGRAVSPDASLAFGRRRGVAASIKLTSHARTDRAVMESVPGGWLFLIPRGLGRGALQAVFAGDVADPGADLQRLLAHSRVMSLLIEEIVDDHAGFVAMPRLAAEPCTSRSIVVGDAAMTLDPMSGNGIGSGLKSALLAAAVLDAARRETVPQACFDHYAQRLRDAQRSHVRTCIDFYGRSAHAADWQEEIGRMSEALDRLPRDPDLSPFRLNNGRLDRVTATATT